MAYIPQWYNSYDVGKVRKPELARAAFDGAAYAKSGSAKKSNKQVVLVAIDQQLDFINPDIGALCVPGSIADSDRLNRWIYANVGLISHIMASLDSHYLFQPFSNVNWRAGSNPANKTNGNRYTEGDNPDPFTIIALQDLRNDVWRPTNHPKEMQEYLTYLEKNANKQLCIWPFHCIVGSIGHSFDPSFLEAMFFHSAFHANQYDAFTKGLSALSEQYGIFRGEKIFPGDKASELNLNLVSKITKADRTYVAGQAKSHCVLETLNQLVSILQNRGLTECIKKIYVLTDCMSSVPDFKDDNGNTIIAFDQITEKRFSELRELGMNFVQSTDLIEPLT